MGSILIRNAVLMMVSIALIVVFAVSASKTPNETTSGTKFTVRVVNKMAKGGMLFVHCKSREDDLGPQKLARNQDFSWRFKENYVETTLFWCYFRSSWGHAEFDVFWPEERTSFLLFRCDHKECIWNAKDEGIYLHNIPYNIDDYKHDWNTTKLVRR